MFRRLRLLLSVRRLALQHRRQYFVRPVRSKVYNWCSVNLKVEESRSGPQVSVGKALQPVLLFKAERIERLVRRPDDDEVNEDVNDDDNYEEDDL